jgi:hypothetical protein
LLTAEKLHVVLYFSTEYHTSKQNIIILIANIYLIFGIILDWGLAISFLGIRKSKIVWSGYMAAGVAYSSGKQHKMVSLKLNGRWKNKLVMTFVTVLLVFCSISSPPPHIINKKRNQGKKQQELHKNPDPPRKNFD